MPTNPAPSVPPAAGRILTVTTFRLKPSAAFRGCACTGAYDERPEEEPIGIASYVVTEEGDSVYSSTFPDRASAVSGIAAQMAAAGVRIWGIHDDDGSIEMHGADADVLLADDPAPLRMAA